MKLQLKYFDIINLNFPYYINYKSDEQQIQGLLIQQINKEYEEYVIKNLGVY